MTRDYLILKLQGPMQSWGEHTFESKRPSGNFPTLSALLGLLGACLGIRRDERTRLEQLADSVSFAVRRDIRTVQSRWGGSKNLSIIKMTDYHTIKDARKSYTGLQSHETIQTWREYLLDAEYTVVVWSAEQPIVMLDELEKAVKRPFFTPYLGRRSCPLARPLFLKRITADSEKDALQTIEPLGGVIYSEYSEQQISEPVRTMRLRDVPLIRQPRQFTTRTIYVHGGDHASK